MHIFEKRYQKLISDVQDSYGSFGVIPFINGTVADFGTEVEVIEIVRTYKEGQMDITCRGNRVFRVEQFYSVPPEKGYSSADVSFMSSEEESTLITRQKSLELILSMSELLGSDFAQDLMADELHSSDFIHKLGLELSKELELLCLLDEEERLQSINAYMEDFLPALERAEEIRKRIELNGHFKKLDPLDL